VSLGLKDMLCCAVLGGVLCARGAGSAPRKSADFKKRPVTVADAVVMTRVAGSPYPAVHPKSGFAVFSPNGKYFAVVVAKGNLDSNTNDYSLLLFRSADISHAGVPTKLATFASSSNRAGISEVRWLGDSTILFLGCRGEKPTELYSIQLSSGRLKKLTNHSESLLSYDVSEDGDKVVYAAERPDYSIMAERTVRSGFDVGKERPADLVRGLISSWEPEIFIKGSGQEPDRRLRTKDPFESGVNDLFLSPNGRYFVVKTNVTDLKEDWRQYDDRILRMAFRLRRIEGAPTRVPHYELIDTRTGISRGLLDAPATFSPSDVLWAPDSVSLILCGTYLPLDVKDPAELEARRSTRYVVEVGIAGSKFIKITTESLKPVRWDRSTNTVEFTAQTTESPGGSTDQPVYYRKTAGVWERLPGSPGRLTDRQPDPMIEEDMNHPPRMVARDPKNSGVLPLLDLNPEFARLAFAGEREIHWTGRDGKTLDGGLYLPPDFVPGKKYPLVIQTHGFDPHEFWIDGPYATAFAAQPLASRGIAVLQVNDIFFDTMETPQEMDRALDAYESAIDYLDQKGFIDPNSVGLIGFSRTCLYVKYALTHSRRHIAAAVVSDGIDAGYLQYLLSYNSNPGLSSDFESIIGGPPFGASLHLWLENSPGFLLDKVETPLLLEPIGPNSVLGEWQWFAGLKRLRKPVDMLYLPGGTHILVKPWDRMTSEQVSVDWFCFWLKGEEDGNPEKAKRYSLWRDLRAEANVSLQQ
jgi:dipeptidyl aminopeptidase/acylaminoacyl peptidase